jgi:tetratricopeptide (TPR) repeat protein
MGFLVVSRLEIMADIAQFKEAAAAVRHSPHAVSAWEEVEGLAADLDKPDEIVTLYNEALGGSVEPQVAEMIGERAGGFCDEWFGDDPLVLEKILNRVIKLSPASETALQRLSVIYTVAERWTDALGLYDRAVDATKDKSRRVRLLREAAQLAKDVANQPDKAIGYYQALLPLTPDDGQISQSLERLLERHERWADLITLWESRLDAQGKRERERSRIRIATVWLDNLNDPARALAATKPLLSEADDDKEPCRLLERVLESANANAPTRDATLDLLRSHHDAAQRPKEVIRVLEKVIALDPSSSGPRHEEAGSRLAELDELAPAMDHYSALLAMEPGSTATEEKLRGLAERGGLHDKYADGVAAAARQASDPTRRVELLGEAARTRLERLTDVEGAIKLLVEASEISGASDHEQLGVARRLAALYEQTNRPRERLGVLERQAHLEANEVARSALLSEAAKLAESLGDTDRALSLWERRIDSDPDDLSGLDARIGILQTQNRWDDLVAALESRANKVTAPNQKRADLVRVALVHHQQRSDLPAAINAWQRVVADHKDDEEGISALADLLAETQRWAEMADLLESSSGRATSRTVARLVRLGDALREHLEEPVRALSAYRNAIAIDPASKQARAGLTALLDGPTTRAIAADALAQAFRINGDLGGVLDLLPARLAEAKDDRTRLALLREAAQLRLEHKHDAPGALADLAKAFPLSPRDQLIENQILSLAKTTGDFATAASAYRDALTALGQSNDAREAARLRLAYADLVADHLEDKPAAADAYAQVVEVEPGNRRAVHAFASLGTELHRWDASADAVVRYCDKREGFDDELLSILEVAAAKHNEWDAVTTAVTAAIDSHKMPTSVASVFHHRLSVAHRDKRNDKPAAIKALRRALELGGEKLAWLSDLVALEREAGASPALLESLRRLSDADGRDLDSLVGAADVASKLGEREQALQILSAVLGRATAGWRGTASVRSARSIDAVAKWAIDALVDLYRTGGRARAAVDTLVEAARLPFDQATRREMRLRAAQLATVELGDNAAAIDMYRSVLAQTPNDLEVIERLAHLLGLEDRVPELLTLRQIQLGLETDTEKKLTLRLELAKLVGIVEERGGRLDALKANLEDRPGHDESIDAVSHLLASKGQHRSLADLLEQQAQRLETAGDQHRAAKLWSRYAHVAESDTKEIERAISGHRRVVALAPTSESLRALARLNIERGQSAQAVPWLESLLGTVPAGERMMVVGQLAKAHLSANQPDRAITALEVNLDDGRPGGTREDPALELRALLADLYRKSEQWEPLARHLTRSLPLIKDEKLAREYAREASTIYLTKLESPAKAIPALETALQLDPTDKDLRTALAIGQRVAGKLEESRKALTELISDFGRRRSPDRAALHVELARVAQAEGKLDEAMTEMESASKMDVSNAAIQKELAEMARTAGQLDKAEKVYRALLLVVRRQPPGDDENAVGSSEVLYELHKLADAGSDQAKELLESAMEAAIQSDAEVRRIRRSLIKHDQIELLLKILERRLATNPDVHSQARLLSDMAEALDRLGRGAEALDALIRAIGAMPSRIDLHDRAREVAKKNGQTKRFVEAVDSVVDRLRRKDDPPLIANLLMRAGEALEQDASDLRGAANLYRRVEILGERLAEAFYAQARVAASLGDTAEQARTLDKMFELAGTDSEPTPAQVDALYRLSEIFLGSETRRKQGFELLERAFAAEPRWGQAGRLLKAAASSDAADEKVMTMYERVARNGGDGELLLDFLERRAALPSATTQQIREAVDLAVDQGQEQRAEALLVRAVAAARETADGLGSAPWAVLALAERRLAAGDLTQARDLAYEIAPIAEAEQIDGLAMRIATRALAHRRVDLAADVYEFLRERNPSDRAVWQPLLTIYRETGDGDRLGSVISSTLPNLMTPAERNALRLEHAKFLIENLKRYHDALDVLRDALSDDPDNLEAAELYEATLRNLGDDDGIAEFLWSRFEDAQRRGHRDSTVDVALRLGDLLEKTGSPDAVRVYRAALIVAPDDREILRRVVELLGENDNPREGAVLMERLLAVETPERAPALAGKLASMWEAAGDVKGVQRTLELAHHSAPDDSAIHDRLEKWYRDRELWAELAELMTKDAERMTDDTKAVERLREAASTYSGFLGQPLKAAEVLRKARQRAPNVPELVTDHAAALAAAGELDAAQRAIGEALSTVKGTGRVSLLLLRASFRQQLGDDASAVTDLTEAYELDKDRSEALVNGLERLRSRAERDGDMPSERTATLRLAQILTTHDEIERGRGFLVTWIERDPRDAEPLYMLCDLDESIGHWDGVSAAATRLAYITEAEAQVNSAMRAATASTTAGRPADAVPVLEFVHQAQPAVEVLRDKLREIYEAAGEYRQLAGVLIADADHGNDPTTRYANYKRAAELLLYQLQDAASAQHPAARALELQPDDHAALMLNVDVLISSEQLEDASRTLEAAIQAQKKRTPELAVLQQRMARVSAMLNDKDGQLNWLKKAFDVDRKNAEVAAELAQLATEIGDYELALKPLRAITLMDNPSPVTRPMALLWEAKIEHARGNRAKAELWAKKALREDPAFADAQQFLDELGGS